MPNIISLRITVLIMSIIVWHSGFAPVQATDRHVPAQYPTIQAAINAALDGDTGIIIPGTYTGDGNRGIDFLGKALTVRGANPDDPL